MFRTIARAARQPLRAQQTSTRRSFVSTVLLSKTYDDKTVPELRSELRARGLSAVGTKATLITRMQQADAALATSEAPSSPAPAPAQARSASTSAASTAEAAPASSSIPRSNDPPMTFNIKIPVYQAPPEPPVQVPFLPDFWDSSAVKKAEAAAAASPTSASPTPKIMLAAGAETHPAGGPTFALSPVTDSIPSLDDSTPASAPKKYDGVIGDIFDDIGIPHDVFAGKTTASETQELGAKRTVSTRPLDTEERRGAYTLLGLLFGAWVVAGIAAPSHGKSEKKASKEKH